MANAIFSTKIGKCPLCKGRGLTDIEGGQEQCLCQISDKMDKYIAAYLDNSTLTESKLLRPLKEGVDYLIECDRPDTMASQFKTALIKRQDTSITWRVVHPQELVNLYWHDDIKVRESLFKVDLLIINVPTFITYEKGGQTHEYIFTQRRGLGKATWIVVPSKKKFLTTHSLAHTAPLMALVDALPSVKLTYENTAPYAKSQRDIPTCVSPGVGMSGVDPLLMGFNLDMDKRIDHLKEHLHERKRATPESDGDDS